MSQNEFEVFGIKHLSCSALGRWQGCRGAWVAGYLYGLWGTEGPGLWRGKAVESGLDALFKGRSEKEAYAHAMREFENGAGGETDEGNIDKERGSVIAMIEQGVAAWKEHDLPPVRASQIRTELWLDGVGVPIAGYLDFALEGGFSVDLKSTHRCPSEPSFTHKLQIASYAKARGEKKAGILYVTTKKAAYYEIGEDEIDAAIVELTRRAKGLQSSLRSAVMRANLEKSEPKDVLASMCPPDPDSFYWDDGSLAEALEAVPAWR